MKVRKQFRSSWAGAVVGIILAAGWGWLLHDFTIGTGLVHLSYDLSQDNILVARQTPPVEDVVVVAMDEESHQALAQPLNAPWDRALHAQLIDRLTAADAQVIVFDIIFGDPGNATTDARLADAMRTSGRVILGAESVLIGPEMRQYDLPFDRLRVAAAGIGSTELVPDRDLVVRRHSPEDVLPPLSLAAASLARSKIGQETNALTPTRWMRYYDPDHPIPTISYHEALDPAKTPGTVFRDKIVFIGARLQTKFSGERKDEFLHPHSAWIGDQHAEHRFIPGVAIHALCCANLLRGDWLSRFSPPVERAWILFAGVLFGFGLIQFRPLAATGVAVTAFLTVLLMVNVLFQEKLVWFPWLIPAVQLAAALLWSIVFNSIRLYVENRLYVQSLELYLSPKLVKKFASDKTLLNPGAQKQTLTILFSDIADFTSVSEGMDSDELARLMNRYFQSAVAQCIHATDGTVVKYIGDAIFAFWNAPDPQPDHAIRACEAALRFRDQPSTLVREQPLVTRIGLHTGEANVGNFGSARRFDYTAIGENINLASRMEGLNKYLGTQVLLTGETHRLVGERFVSRPLGRFRLKGFEKSVEVFELVGPTGQAEPSRPLRAAFGAALKKFQERDFSGAQAAFERVLETVPNDGPSLFYLRQIAELHDHVLPPSWAGEVELKEK